MLEGFLDRFKYLAEVDENKLMREVLEDGILQAQIIDLNQDQLYNQGLQANDEPTGNYALKTIQYKEAYGDARQTPGRVDHITGLDTGQTYESMRVVNGEDEITIIADDRNGFFKVETNGLGLTEKSIDELRPEIIERIIDKVKDSFAA